MAERAEAGREAPVPIKGLEDQRDLCKGRPHDKLHVRGSSPVCSYSIWLVANTTTLELLCGSCWWATNEHGRGESLYDVLFGPFWLDGLESHGFAKVLQFFYLLGGKGELGMALRVFHSNEKGLVPG